MTTTPSDMLPECAEGLSPCGGECVNLMTSYEHCGACDHECNEEDASGVCEMGRCTAVYAGCINEDDGFATCREFCTSLGEKCGAETEAEWHPCYGAVPWFEEQDCKFAQHRYSAEPGQPGAVCDWIIPFNEVVEFNFVLQSVRCCCTQYGGE